MFQNCPIIHIIPFEALTAEKIIEDPPQVGISRLVPKLERTDVIKISCKFLGETIAEIRGTNFLFHLLDKFQLPFFGCSLDFFPGEGTAEEVYH